MYMQSAKQNKTKHPELDVSMTRGVKFLLFTFCFIQVRL